MKNDIEIWVSVKGYEERYEVSSFGKVKSVKYNKILKPSDDQVGYLQVILYDKNVKTKTFKVHRLVALNFVPPIIGKDQVNHIDGVKRNNYASNLEWCTRSENTKHKYAIGLDTNKGINHPSCKLTESQVLKIRERFKNGETNRKLLASDYSISHTHIFSIIKRTSWSHI